MAIWPENLETKVLGEIHRSGPLTRWELHRQTGVRANTIGQVARAMLAKRLLRENGSEISGPGRPRVPLDIDGTPWRAMGVSVRPRGVSCCRLTPRGEIEELFPEVTLTSGSRDAVTAAAEVVTEHIGSDILCIGLCVPGFADFDHRRLLLSSLSPGERGLSLEPIFDAAGDCPVVLDNDMSALAARWWLSETPGSNETTLVVLANDGAIGGSLLINGKPNYGSVLGGAELGHMRFGVETDVCRCGRTGCLARIFSSAFLATQAGRPEASLDDAIAGFNPDTDRDADGPALVRMIEHLATGIANAVNLVRPHRLVLVTRYADNHNFLDTLQDCIRLETLDDIGGKLTITVWPEAGQDTSIEAGFLALSAIYSEDWRNSSRA